MDVDLDLDEVPRVVTVPADFAAALSRDEGAQAAFDAMSVSQQQRHVLVVEGAKTPATRQRRIDKAIADLSQV